MNSEVSLLWNEMKSKCAANWVFHQFIFHLFSDWHTLIYITLLQIFCRTGMRLGCWLLKNSQNLSRRYHCCKMPLRCGTCVTHIGVNWLVLKVSKYHRLVFCMRWVFIVALCLFNQASRCAVQHIWCLSPARINSEVWGRKGIWCKIGGWWR